MRALHPMLRPSVLAEAPACLCGVTSSCGYWPIDLEVLHTTDLRATTRIHRESSHRSSAASPTTGPAPRRCGLARTVPGGPPRPTKRPEAALAAVRRPGRRCSRLVRTTAPGSWQRLVGYLLQAFTAPQPATLPPPPDPNALARAMAGLHCPARREGQGCGAGYSDRWSLKMPSRRVCCATRTCGLRRRGP